jgi:aminopeptidase N
MDHRQRSLLSTPWVLLLALAAGCAGMSPHPCPTGSMARADARSSERGFDVLHYALDLGVRPEARAIEGSCSVRLASTVDALREVDLDLEGLVVRGIRDPLGRELAYRREGTRLSVTLPEPLGRGAETELTVLYGGKPVDGLWFSGQRGADGTPTQVFTQGQTDHARGWFPCVDRPDERATSELRVTIPQDWVAFAAGRRDDVSDQDGRRVEHWTMDVPHASYLLSLTAGEFVVLEGDWDGIPLFFAAEPRYAEWIPAAFAETDEILGAFSELTGIRYPYAKYSQVAVANFPWGGMENVSNTTLTSLALGDELCQQDHPATDLVAHEAAHQWFGDLLTCRDWSELWLNEGFATYFGLLYFEKTRGPDEFRARLRDAQQAYVEQDRGTGRRPTVWAGFKDAEDAMDTRAYEGAAARLHLLRYLLGDERFFAGIRTYVAEYAGRAVTTADLKRAMEKVSGQNLERFFQQWIWGRGYPEFLVDWRFDRDRRQVVLDVKQTQATADGTPIFTLPVDVEVLDEGGRHVHRLELEGRSQRFELPVDGQPFYVQFDKYGWIPKAINWKRSPAEWLAILDSDDDVNGRRDALRALGDLAASAQRLDPSAHETYVGAMVHALLRDGSAWVRASAAEALARAQGVEARKRLIAAAQSDAEARVRVAALRGLAAFGPSDDLAQVAERAFEARASWATMGAAAGLRASADPAGALPWLREKLALSSPHDELRAYLFEHLGRLPGREAGDELRRWVADQSIDSSARAAAVQALAGRTAEVVENARCFAPLLGSPDFRLRKAAVVALSSLSDDTARKALRAYYPNSQVASEKRAIEASLSGPVR